MPYNGKVIRGLILPMLMAGASLAEPGFRPYYEGVTNNPFKAKLGLPLADGGFVREGYNLWDSSVIKVGDTYHMFASCWPSNQLQRVETKFFVSVHANTIFRPKTGFSFKKSKKRSHF